MFTPNTHHLWQPPLGSNREVYMRWDYMYRDDDPLLWPQLYCPEYLHLACMRTQPLNQSPSDKSHALFAGLTHGNFQPCDELSIVPHIGKLSGAQFGKLKAACMDVVDAAR